MFSSTIFSMGTSHNWTHYYPEFLLRVHVVAHLKGLNVLCKVKLCGVTSCPLIYIYCCFTDQYVFSVFFFFFFFYTRQKFSSALATLKFSQISLSFLLVKEDILIIKGPWCRYCVWSPHLIIHLSLLLQFLESDGCVKQLRHMCCQYWLYYTYCL